MSKTKKKRTKSYQGEDAHITPQPPHVRRYSAIERSQLNEWWTERKKMVLFITKLVAGIIFTIWILYEAARLLF